MSDLIRTTSNAADVDRQISYRMFENGLGWEDVLVRFVHFKHKPQHAIMKERVRGFWRDYHREHRHAQ